MNNAIFILEAVEANLADQQVLLDDSVGIRTETIKSIQLQVVGRRMFQRLRGLYQLNCLVVSSNRIATTLENFTWD